MWPPTSSIMPITLNAGAPSTSISLNLVGGAPSNWAENDRSGRLAPGHQHRHAAPVAAVFIAEEIDQIALFQQDADDDVSGGDGREQQVPDRHRRRRPERDDEAE